MTDDDRPGLADALAAALQRKRAPKLRTITADNRAAAGPAPLALNNDTALRDLIMAAIHTEGDTK